MQEFMARLAVTLGALAVYSLGTHIPLAGIDQTGLKEIARGSVSVLAVERISIFALGVTPLISALLLVEVARLASERFNDWVDAAPRNARRVNSYVLIGALLIAAMQGNGIANALEAVGNFIAEPGPQFRLNVVVASVASTALLAWLATMISRNGLGSGIWVLLLVPHLASLPGNGVTLDSRAGLPRRCRLGSETQEDVQDNAGHDD